MDGRKLDEFEHYPDEDWENIYKIGNVYSINNVFIDVPEYTVENYNYQTKETTTTTETKKFINTRKIHSVDLYGQIKKEINRDYSRIPKHNKIELYIYGALIAKNIWINPDTSESFDGGYIRYLKLNNKEIQDRIKKEAEDKMTKKSKQVIDQKEIKK